MDKFIVLILCFFFSCSFNKEKPEKTQAWDIIDTIPAMRAGAGAVYYDHKVFIFGGVEPNPPEYETQMETDVYDILNKKWIKKSNIPIGKALFGTVVLNKKIYIIGGNVYDKMTMLEYDPDKDTWTEKAPLPTPRQQLGAVVLNGKIYTFGGSKGHNISEAFSFEVYDPLTDTWEVRKKLDVPLQNCATAKIGNKIYAIGGHSVRESQNAGNLIMCYDAQSDKWSIVSYLSKSKTEISATEIEDKVYIFGGHPEELTDVEVFDTKTLQSKIVNNMPKGRSGHNSLQVDGKILIVAGTVDEIWSFTP
jgi:N-acetylneuraminic acid mutarotase